MPVGRKPNLVPWGKDCILCNSFIVYVQYLLWGRGGVLLIIFKKRKSMQLKLLGNVEGSFELNQSHCVSGSSTNINATTLADATTKANRLK
jgi:hypothetical protein